MELPGNGRTNPIAAGSYAILLRVTLPRWTLISTYGHVRASTNKLCIKPKLHRLESRFRLQCPIDTYGFQLPLQGASKGLGQPSRTTSANLQTREHLQCGVRHSFFLLLNNYLPLQPRKPKLKIYGNCSISGSAVHGGGSCQGALSYDKGNTWIVIKSWVGNCPHATPGGDQTLKLPIPSDAPSGVAVFAW